MSPSTVHTYRVSAKYCHNKLSPMWPCSVPFYVSRPHSILQSYIFAPVKTSSDVKSVNEMECVTMTTQSEVKGQDGHEVAAANLSQDINDDDVIGEFPPLSTMLHVSGYRIPHRLGVRFKSEAHARYHTIHVYTYTVHNTIIIIHFILYTLYTLYTTM